MHLKKLHRRVLDILLLPDLWNHLASLFSWFLTSPSSFLPGGGSGMEKAFPVALGAPWARLESALAEDWRWPGGKCSGAQQRAPPLLVALLILPAIAGLCTIPSPWQTLNCSPNGSLRNQHNFNGKIVSYTTSKSFWLILWQLPFSYQITSKCDWQHFDFKLCHPVL